MESSQPEDLQINATIIKDTAGDAHDDTNGSETDPTLDLTIALRKMPQTCTLYPISKALAFSCFRDSYKKLVNAFSLNSGCH